MGAIYDILFINNIKTTYTSLCEQSIDVFFLAIYIQTSRSKWQPYNISVPLDLKVTKDTRLILNIIYVWKLNQTVLELDFRAVKFLFFPRRDLNVVEWSRALDVRLSEWCCSKSMVWVQILSREEQKFDSSKI